MLAAVVEELNKLFIFVNFFVFTLTIIIHELKIQGVNRMILPVRIIYRPEGS
jgi:hypothetical protein